MSDRTGKMAAAAILGTALAAATPAAAAPAPAPEVRIGVIDSGASPQIVKDRNARLVSKVFHNGVRAGWDGSTAYSHGDLVCLSALATARAVAPDAHVSIYAANVYMPSDDKREDGKIRYRMSYEGVHKALDWMKSEGVSVVVFTGTGQDTQPMRDVVDHVKRNGMVMVASTNNALSQEKVFPAAYPDVISVAGNDPSLPIFRSPVLASYVSYVAEGMAPVRDSGAELGSSFAAGRMAGYAAALAARDPSPTQASVRAALDARSARISYSGRDIPTVTAATVLASAPDRSTDRPVVAEASPAPSSDVASRPTRMASLAAAMGGMAR
jgi:hypothetical protein